MLIGLTNTPATFQTYINQALQGLVDNFCIVYLNNILIFSKNEEEYKTHLQQVLEHLKHHKLYVKSNKYSFFQTEIKFLSFIVSQKGVQIDPRRIQTITKWLDHPPITFQNIQMFLGFCNFYKRFIYCFAVITHPLHTLLRGMRNRRKAGKIGHEWQEPQKKAFKQLIIVFTIASILQYYNPTLPIRIKTNVNDFALATIISQLYPDSWHLIAFLLKKFTNIKDNYPIYNKELITIVIIFHH